LSATRENRLLDVYLVTAPGRKPPAAKADPEGQIFSDQMQRIGFETAGPDGALSMPKYLNLAALESVNTEGTVDEFCRLIESELDRPVVNETNLQGDFQFAAESSKGGSNDFLNRLRDQSGLVYALAEKCASAGFSFALIARGKSQQRAGLLNKHSMLIFGFWHRGRPFTDSISSILPDAIDLDRCCPRSGR
jgi:hypothetical protein